MQTNNEQQDTSGFSFQVDLLNLNLHLAETEKTQETQKHAHEVALEQIRTLVPRF